MRTGRTVFAGTMALLLLGSSWAVAGTTPTPVLATSNDEYLGSGNGDYTAWTYQSDAHPDVIKVKFKPTGGTVTALNDRGRWLAGRMDQYGTRLPYFRIHGGLRDRTGDIFIYDMASQADVAVPPNVNTNQLEAFPALSGTQMTFVRETSSSQTLFLVTDLNSGSKVAVKTVDLTHGYFANAPDFIGNWVTYAVCRRSGCEAYRYDIPQGITELVPNPLDKFSFAPAADLDGNVYVERSGAACGSDARLMKWTGSGDPTVFYSFAAARDMNGTYVDDDGGGNVTLYVDILGCGHRNRDIVSFLNP